MPLLNKKPLERIKTPEGLTPNDRVFYLEATREVFTNHSDYFNRMVLLNSTLWSCEYTRKTNLTYFEALESEQEALNELNDFPSYLLHPILYIVKNFTNRGRFEDLVNDIYFIMKERFFSGEIVTYTEKSRKYQARILGSYIVDDVEQEPMPETIKEPRLPPPENYRYNLMLIDNYSGYERDSIRENVMPYMLFRSKNSGSRQKVKLFLKNSTFIPWPGDHYIVRERFLDDGIVYRMEWNEILAGNEPICPKTPVTQRGRIPNVMKPGYVEPEKKPKSVETPRPRGRPKKDITQETTPKISEKKLEKIRQQHAELEFFFAEAKRLDIDVKKYEKQDRLLTAKAVAELKQKVKEAKDKEREMNKEEKKRKMKEKTNYNRKREDLQCDDLKPMPRLKRLELPKWLADDEFADYLIILQFFSSFRDILPLKDIRGSDEVFLSDVVIAMKCNDPQNSPYADLMRVLLAARSDAADDEDGDEADFTSREEMNLLNSQNCDPSQPVHGDRIREATLLHEEIRKVHGKSARHLPVDWMTLSEILRLLLRTAGYYTGIATHRHRLFTRGYFKGYEDPGYELRYRKPELIEKLRTETVFDLDASERTILMKTIIEQLLTYAKFRAHLESKHQETMELRKELRRLKTWDQAQDQESNAARVSLENGETKATGEIAQSLKSLLKLKSEGMRYDQKQLDNILLESVPYDELTLDELVTARELQKIEVAALQKDLIAKIYDMHARIGDVYLGSDRIHRRYFVIDQLAAILVEDDVIPHEIGECEEATEIKDEENRKDSLTHQVFVCSGEMSTCGVHGPNRMTRPRWCYVDSAQKLQELMATLNVRGLREVSLLEELNYYKQPLEDLLTVGEESKKTGEWTEMLMTKDADPAETYNIDWVQEFKDLLLDFEEKMDEGQMGSICSTWKIDRNEWRECVKDNVDLEKFINTDVVIGNEVIWKKGEPIGNEVKRLAMAFLMTVQCIGLKFIKMPFVVTKDRPKVTDTFKRWQRKLTECESLSALSLFLSTLEAAIQWEKSRLQGKCTLCRRKASTKELVLCCECDRCFHLACVRLKKAPSDWMCKNCREENEEEDEEEEEEDSENMARTSSGRAIKRVVVDDSPLKVTNVSKKRAKLDEEGRKSGWKREKMVALEQLVKESMRQEFAWPFLEPVDPKEIPDYYDVIKRPMDLRSMMNKMKQRIYNKPEEVLNDFRLILSNCEVYNETDSEVYQLSRQLEEFMLERMQSIVNQD